MAILTDPARRFGDGLRHTRGHNAMPRHHNGRATNLAIFVVLRATNQFPAFTLKARFDFAGIGFVLHM